MTCEPLVVETNSAGVAVAVLTLNWPGKLNALTDLMFTELHAAVQSLETRDDVQPDIRRAASGTVSEPGTFQALPRPVRAQRPETLAGRAPRRSRASSSGMPGTRNSPGPIPPSWSERGALPCRCRQEAGGL